MLTLLVLLVAGAPEQRPDEPKERLTVFVFTDQADDENVPKGKFPIRRVTDEVRKRVRDRKKWFVTSDRREDADVLVEVMNHKVEERMRTRMEYRVDNSGVNKEMVEVSWAEEHHYIEARVQFPSGHQVLIDGLDLREKGGSLKGAASDLAVKLEELCVERYAELQR